MMKPFPGRVLTVAERIYNYRLSRARRVVENAFGILSARFRVFRNAIHLDADKTKRLTLACCALHNFLIEKTSSYMGDGLLDIYGSNDELIRDEWSSFAQPEESGIHDTPSQYIQYYQLLRFAISSKIFRDG